MPNLMRDWTWIFLGLQFDTQTSQWDEGIPGSIHDIHLRNVFQEDKVFKPLENISEAFGEITNAIKEETFK